MNIKSIGHALKNPTKKIHNHHKMTILTTNLKSNVPQKIRPQWSQNSTTAWKSRQNHPTSIWKRNTISIWCVTATGAQGGRGAFGEGIHPEGHDDGLQKLCDAHVSRSRDNPRAVKSITDLRGGKSQYSNLTNLLKAWFANGGARLLFAGMTQPVAHLKSLLTPFEKFITKKLKPIFYQTSRLTKISKIKD